MRGVRSGISAGERCEHLSTGRESGRDGNVGRNGAVRWAAEWKDGNGAGKGKKKKEEKKTKRQKKERKREKIRGKIRGKKKKEKGGKGRKKKRKNPRFEIFIERGGVNKRALTRTAPQRRWPPLFAGGRAEITGADWMRFAATLNCCWGLFLLFIVAGQKD